MSAVNSWYFTLETLKKPVRIGGTDYETSKQRRQELFRFVKEIGYLMKVPQLTISTSCVYLHRFFVRKDYSDYDIYDMGMAAFFLASKVEETHTRLKDVVGCGYQVRYQYKISDAELMQKTINRLLTLERVLLQTISFDFTIEHPYKPFLDGLVQLQIQDDDKLKQAGWNFINDSYGTAVCLQFKCEEIAAAAIHLAAEFCKKNLLEIDGKMWNEVLKVDMEIIEQIAMQIREGIAGQSIQKSEKREYRGLKRIGEDLSNLGNKVPAD